MSERTEAVSGMVPEAELAALLQREGLSIDPTSPLAHLAGMKAGTTKVRSLDDATRAAIAQVANPGLELDLRISSAVGETFFTFFAEGHDSERLVGHFRDPHDRHYFGWVDADDMDRPLAQKLLLEAPTEPGEFVLDGRLVDLYAFAAVVDLWRRRAMEALLTHDRNEPTPFDLAELFATARVAIASGDSRWLSGLLQELCAPQFTPSEHDLEQGLSALTRKGTLAREGAHYAVTPGMDAIAYSLSAPLVRAAVLSRLKVGTGWQNRQLVALRGVGVLFLVELQGDQGAETPIRLWQATGPDLDLAFERCLHPRPKRSPRRRAAPKAEAKATAGPERVPCANCGHMARSDRKFCSRCGVRILGKPLGAPVCPACGEEVSAQAKFCGGCGARRA